MLSDFLRETHKTFFCIDAFRGHNDYRTSTLSRREIVHMVSVEDFLLLKCVGMTIQTIQPQAGGSISLNMTYGNAHLNKSIKYNLKRIIFYRK